MNPLIILLINIIIKLVDISVRIRNNLISEILLGYPNYKDLPLEATEIVLTHGRKICGLE